MRLWRVLILAALVWALALGVAEAKAHKAPPASSARTRSSRRICMRPAPPSPAPSRSGTGTS